MNTTKYITNYITTYYSHRKWLTQPHNTTTKEIAQVDGQLFECIDEKTRIVKRLLVLEEEQMLCGMEMRKSQKLMQADSAKEMEIRKRLMEHQDEMAKSSDDRDLNQV